MILSKNQGNLTALKFKYIFYHLLQNFENPINFYWFCLSLNFCISASEIAEIIMNIFHIGVHIAFWLFR